jgi:ABC-2 type transport system permease protein
MSSFFTVTKKELQDHFNSWRLIILLLIMVAAIVYVFLAARNIQSNIDLTTKFLFLPIFTGTAVTSESSLIPTTFINLMAVLLPIAGLILGLDAVNSERNNGTLGRLVSQPIFRDNIINAKFLAGVLTIAIILVATVILGGAMGYRITGLMPQAEEILRIFFFLIMGVVYGAFWLGLAILFSTLFRQVAISAIVSLAVWLFFIFFYPLILQAVAGSMTATTDAEFISNFNFYIFLTRISPIQLFNEAAAVTMTPITRSISQVFLLLTTDASSYFVATPLSLGQSLLSVWPHFFLTVLLTLICFAISYVKFMFEEIRSL